MPAPLRFAARVFFVAAAGALAGYFLWKVYYALAVLRPELVAALFGNMKASRYLIEAIPNLMLATPGALLLGIPVGVALRHIAHKRLLLYSVLAWPIGTYAFSTFVLRVLKNLPEQEQVSLWVSRGVGAGDAFFIYSLFFAIAYFSYLLSTRVRAHNPLLRQTRERAVPR